MALRWYSVVIDCHDIHAQARWWAGVLDWQFVYEADDEAAIVPSMSRTVVRPWRALASVDGFTATPGFEIGS